MLEKIQLLNPDYQIQELNENFKDYGRVIKQDEQEAINFAQTYQNINAYDTSIKELEDIPCIQELMKDIYGYLDVMAGVVTGKNDVLNGLEYHQCSETIIAVTDYILAVGKRQDMVENDYDIEKCELFYVPQGTVVELYATTLHYTPITPAWLITGATSLSFSAKPILPNMQWYAPTTMDGVQDTMEMPASFTTVHKATGLLGLPI